MSRITLKGNPVNTAGTLPEVGSKAPEFRLVKTDMSEVALKDFAGKKKVVNIFPSVDTAVCAMSVRTFVKKAASTPNTVVLNISADLPFAHKRFCAAEGIEHAINLSTFRSEFGSAWNVTMKDGPLAGLLSRAVVVLDENNTVKYVEQVPEITSEPNYDKALAALK